MRRRTFLKSLGSLGAAPAIPMSWLASAPASASATAMTSAIPSATLKWAETIARAHATCSTGMLQRHLRLDLAAAKAVKSNLIRTGVITAQADAYGLHTATNPLFDGAFVKPHNAVERVGDSVRNGAKRLKAVEQSDAGISCDDPAVAIMKPMIEKLLSMQA